MPYKKIVLFIGIFMMTIIGFGGCGHAGNDSSPSWYDDSHASSSAMQGIGNARPGNGGFETKEYPAYSEWHNILLGSAFIEIAPPKYDCAYSFSEGMARVCLGGKYGFIDKINREAVPLIYDYTDDFINDMAAVNIGAETYGSTFDYYMNSGGKWGFVDKTGMEVISCKYDFLPQEPTNDGSGRVIGFCDGMAVIGIGSDSYWDCEWGVINKAGEVIVSVGIYGWISSFNDGIARVLFDSKYGLIDTSGNEVVPLKYDWIGSFSEGLAAVRIGDWEAGKYGFIDKTGKEAVTCRYNYVSPFSEGLATVSFGSYVYEDGEEFYKGKWGFIDKSGKEIVPMKYDYVCDFSEGFAAVNIGARVWSDEWGLGPSDGKWGVVDKTGREVVPCQYDYVESFSEGLAVIRHGGKYGFIDVTGSVVVPCQYTSVHSFSEGLAAVRLGDSDTGKWGFVDTVGREAVLCQFDDACSFSEGLAAVRIGDRETGKWGFIDTAGEKVMPCQFDDVYSFSEGIAAVNLDGRWGYIAVVEKEAPKDN